jgi:hypothetical protein
LGLQKGQVQDKSKLFKHHMTAYREPTHIYTPCTLESSQSPTETQITLQSAEGVEKGKMISHASEHCQDCGYFLKAEGKVQELSTFDPAQVELII